MQISSGWQRGISIHLGCVDAVHVDGTLVKPFVNGYLYQSSTRRLIIRNIEMFFITIDAD